MHFGASAMEERPPTAADVSELARLSMAHDVGLSRVFVDALRSSGLSLDVVLLEVLAPAARLLGELWAKDFCGFADVTVGLCRLQQLARELGSAYERDVRSHRPQPRVLLSPAPGEQHVFGLILVEHFIRRAGFDVETLVGDPTTTMVPVVADTWITAVGITVGSDDRVGPVAELVGRLRRGSTNPGLLVLVGGSCASRDPDLAHRVGADAAPPDVRGTVDFLERYAHPEGRGATR